MKRNFILLSFGAALVAILFFWWNGSGGLFSQGLPMALLALGRLYGLLAVYSILCQFLLVGRSSVLEKEFGLDVLSRIHQKNGKIAITFILLHPLFIVTSYSMLGKIDPWSQIMQFIFRYEDMVGTFVALFLFCFIVGSSMYIARRHLKYEVWYYIHLATYIAVLLAFGHQLELGGDFLVNTLFTYFWYFLYAFVFGMLLFYRFFLPIVRSMRHGFYVSDIVHETKNTVSYYIAGDNMNTFRVKGGQFMIFRFLTKGLWHEAHPFSLSRLNDGKTIRLTAKKAGDFTLKIPDMKKGTKVLIDGPYGIFTTKRARTKKILFLAGGVGITPIRSLIEEMGPKKFEMTLLYQNKKLDDIVFKNELDAFAKKFHLKIIHILSSQENFKGEHGTINEERIKQFVPDYLTRDVYFCGSPVFLHATMRLLKKMGIKKSLMHYEQFAFHFSG